MFNCFILLVTENAKQPIGDRELHYQPGVGDTLALEHDGDEGHYKVLDIVHEAKQGEGNALTIYVQLVEDLDDRYSNGLSGRSR